MPPTIENRRIFFMVAEYKELLDSSNCTIENWILISKHIKYFYDKFDGFIVLHGTDTLAYGASFLSFILEGLCKPVIMTGSQIPIGELRSDGRENFLGSLLIAGGDQIVPEVTVFFNNNVSDYFYANLLVINHGLHRPYAIIVINLFLRINRITVAYASDSSNDI